MAISFIEIFRIYTTPVREFGELDRRVCIYLTFEISNGIMITTIYEISERVAPENRIRSVLIKKLCISSKN